jgi:hypothetical protein
MTAQVVSAFYLLRRRQWFFASLFMSLAIGVKITALLFLPAFFFFLVSWHIPKFGFKNAIIVLVCSSSIIFSGISALGYAIKTHGQANFYPQEQLELLVSGFKKNLISYWGHGELSSSEKQKNETSLSEQNSGRVEEKINRLPVIANHPGDLRIKINYIVFGGVVFWLVLLLGGVEKVFNKQRINIPGDLSRWPYGVGLSYLILTAYFVRSAPDARFFLPGLPFILLPFAESAVRLPKHKYMISFLLTLALLQGGYVLVKVYRLRLITESTMEAIHFLEKHRFSPRTIFMYPEGSYRFFPAPHEWYLGYRLREFWRSDNDHRLEILKEFNVGSILIKKHLVAPVDKEITNLGVYPPEFVHEIAGDARFGKIFDNDQISIYSLPYSKSYEVTN